jgi:DNA polymerase
VIGQGRLPAELLLIGEAPGREEDRQGKPFVGDAGAVLREVFAGVQVKGGAYLTNVVACRPSDDKYSGNRTPTPEEIQNCYPRLSWIIRKSRAQKVILFGKTAHGQFGVVRDVLRKAEIRCFHHPAYWLYRGQSSEREKWKKYIREFVNATSS